VGGFPAPAARQAGRGIVARAIPRLSFPWNIRPGNTARVSDGPRLPVEPPGAGKPPDVCPRQQLSPLKASAF